MRNVIKSTSLVSALIPLFKTEKKMKIEWSVFELWPFVWFLYAIFWATSDNPVRNTLGHFPYFVLNAHALRHMRQNIYLVWKFKDSWTFHPLPLPPSNVGANGERNLLQDIFISQHCVRGAGSAVAWKCPNNFAPDCLRQCKKLGTDFI